MLNLTFITGAGISLESGLPLYTNSAHAHSSESRCGFSAEDLDKKRENLIKYYNALAQKVSHAEPSDAHHLIAALAEHYNVSVITQNIDDLHERAGSTCVIHLHGQIHYQHTLMNCCRRQQTYQPIFEESTCQHGSSWRHGIVLYGEPIKQYAQARRLLALTDVLVVIGCSMQTNTANMLVEQVHDACPVYFINPSPSSVPARSRLIKTPAYQGIWAVLAELTDELAEAEHY